MYTVRVNLKLLDELELRSKTTHSYITLLLTHLYLFEILRERDSGMTHRNMSHQFYWTVDTDSPY